MLDQLAAVHQRLSRDTTMKITHQTVAYYPVQMQGYTCSTLHSKTVTAVPAVTDCDFDFSQVRVVGRSPFKCTCVAAHAPALPALSSHAVIVTYTLHSKTVTAVPAVTDFHF